MDDVRALQEFGRDDVALVGGKAANLGELTRAGFPVPPGFVVTTVAYVDFVAGAGLGEPIQTLAATGPAGAPAIRALFAAAAFPEVLRTEIAAAYERLGAPAVAVRSSATAEDLPEASFAGQQDSYLDVLGLDAVVAAVQSCWASLWTDRAVAYRQRQGVDSAEVSLAVVVQQMVRADAAGVLFTVNPLDGRDDEMLVSAARGLGEAVVSGTADSDEVVVRLADQRVSARRVSADPVLTDGAALVLAGLGARVAAHFGGPQDIEWAQEGERLLLVQARPVTALPPPEAPPPTDWTVPDRTALYVRASIVEQLPDPLSPLFADLVDGAVTRSLTALMTELIGPGAVRPGEVGLPTVNGYAYYAYSLSGMLRITLRSGKALLVLGKGRRSSRVRWRTYSRPRYADAVASWSSLDPAAADATELLAGVVALLDAGAEYYTAVQTVIPVAAISEIVFSRVYESLLRRAGDPPAATFLLGFDSLPIRAEQSLFDLAGWVGGRPALAATLRTTSSAELLAERPVAEEDGWPGFWSRLQAHLDRYGHTVYNLDFVNPVPADDPAPLLDALRFYLTEGAAADPYARQRRSVAAREDLTRTVRARLGGVRRPVFDGLLRRAQENAPLREDALADVGLAWPQLRRLLAELGRRLVDAGVVDGAEDVCWLRHEEIATALASPDPPRYQAEVEQRRQVWRGQRRVTPPQVLPERIWLRLFGRMLPATSAAQSGNVLTGLAGSAGRVTAVARVLAGPEDFGRLQPGEVLVANITTPAWTSLFVRAAGVVTDVGGPLSHSSIVAREYGIPAVLGTGVGTKRIRTGQRVTVDGDAGTVTLHADEPAAADFGS
jgi:phosphohistidine swiveling domain-containing protein